MKKKIFKIKVFFKDKNNLRESYKYGMQAKKNQHMHKRIPRKKSKQENKTNTKSQDSRTFPKLKRFKTAC